MIGHYKSWYRRSTHYHRKRGAFENLPELLTTHHEDSAGTQFLSADDALRILDQEIATSRRSVTSNAVPWDGSGGRVDGDE